MAAILSFPVRLLANGALASVESASDVGRAEAIAQVILTRPGEREMVPAFGIPDPLFSGFDQGALRAAVAAFVPDVAVDEVDVVPAGDGVTQRVTVSFS